MDHLHDQELLALLKEGNHHAYEQLFVRYWKLVFTIAHHKCGDEHAALDIVQDIFFQLWENRQRLLITGNFTAWLTAVVKHKVIDWYRATKSRDQQKAMLLLQLQSQSAGEEKAVNHAAIRQLQTDFHNAVEQLPERMKAVYLMSHQANLPIAEIARKLSLKPQSVKNHLQKAKEKLRKMLEHHLSLFW